MNWSLRKFLWNPDSMSHVVCPFAVKRASTISWSLSSILQNILLIGIDYVWDFEYILIFFCIKWNFASYLSIWSPCILSHLFNPRYSENFQWFHFVKLSSRFVKVYWSGWSVAGHILYQILIEYIFETFYYYYLIWMNVIHVYHTLCSINCIFVKYSLNQLHTFRIRNAIRMEWCVVLRKALCI